MALILEDKRLIFVGGKGGVGKTTVSSAIALHLSERIEQSGQNEKILLFSTDPAHSLSDSLNVQITEIPTPITNTLDAIEINADQLMNEFKKEHKSAIQTLLLRGTLLTREETEQAIDTSIAGIDEFTALMKLSSLIDCNKYQTIVVDTAPTGHTVRLLSMPKVINSLIKFFSRLHNRYKKTFWTLTGIEPYDSVDNFIATMTENIFKIYKLITDNEKTEFIIVTIPDLMAIEETKRLSISLHGAGIKVNNIIINNIQPNNDCAFCRSRRNYQNKYIDMINTMYPEINKIYLPLFPEDINGMAYLKMFEIILFSTDLKFNTSIF
jgi:arsenite-transporting ATPase